MSTGDFATANLADHLGDDPSAVAENRVRCASLAGLAVTDLAVMSAVHGASVAVVESGGVVPSVDALVTTHAGIALLALGADCVPIAIADPSAGVIAAVHCGWRGLVAGVVPAAVAVMRELGATDLAAVLGPSICGACYAVPDERIAEVRAAADAAAIAPGHLDVAAGVRAQLTAEGIGSVTVPFCTAEDDRLFSFRRDGRTGRQGMMIWR